MTPALLEAAFTGRAGRRHHHQRRRERGRGRPHPRHDEKLGDVAFWRIAMRPAAPWPWGALPPQAFKPKHPAQTSKRHSYQNDINTSTGGSVLFGLPATRWR